MFFEHSACGEKELDLLQNVKGMFLKKSFAPNAYVYAGLVHPDDYARTQEVAENFLNQVQQYYEDGFDGMKMLEGYPTFIKYTGQGIDSAIYDKFYKFCEEKAFPITVHKFLTMNTRHCYLGIEFTGVKIKADLLKKIYFDNADKMLGKPRKINDGYFEKEIEKLLKYELSELDSNDLKYIRDNLR